jgi:hypothetical protein
METNELDSNESNVKLNEKKRKKVIPCGKKAGKQQTVI